MGAAAPKLRMRLTMPPNWTWYVVPGNWPPNFGRIAATMSRSLRFRLSGSARYTWSCAAWGPVFWEKTPDRPDGTPTVDTIDVNSPGASVVRMIPSMRATISSVSSTRVPTGARTRMMNWLSSEGGKNSVPMSGRIATAVAASARMPPISVLGCPSAQPRARWYSSSSRSSMRPLQSSARVYRLRRAAGASGLSQCRQSRGVTVRETRKEAKSEHEMVKVSGMKRSLAWPSRKTVGMKTTMVVIVDTKMGMATSRAASITARRRGLSGMLRCRLMFSSSTMESSTRRPTARASPPSVKILSVCPSMCMATSVRSSESGMAIEMMTVETNERRKSRMTRKARIEPIDASCQRLWMDWRM